MDIDPAWLTAIAWAAGLAVAPGFIWAFWFVPVSLRQRSRWWLVSPRRAARRVDPRCGTREWRRVTISVIVLAVPALMGGTVIALTPLGLLMLAAGSAVVAITMLVLRDKPRAVGFAWVPFGIAGAVTAVAVYVVTALVLAHGWSGGFTLATLMLTPWLLACLLAGWQVLVASRAQEGAREIARAAFADRDELKLI